MVSTLWKQKTDCFITKGAKNGNSSSDWRWNRNIKSIWVNNPNTQRTFNQLSKRFFDIYSIKLWFMFNVYRNLMRYSAKLIQKHHFLTKSGVFSFLCQQLHLKHEKYCNSYESWYIWCAENEYKIIFSDSQKIPRHFFMVMSYLTHQTFSEICDVNIKNIH